MRASLSTVTILFYILFTGSSCSAQVIKDPIQAHLESKDFKTALANAESGPDRDGLLGRIALAQFASGDVTSSKGTLRRIHDAGVLTRVARKVRQQAAGGGTGADFAQLINLITNTVAPNTWDDVGGPGAIDSFEGGVFVDSTGVLRRAKVASQLKRRALDLLREQPHQDAFEDAQHSSDLRMVSLTRLERELMLLTAFGEAPTDAMKHLAGLREIRYVFLFPETNDCVIAGPAGHWTDRGPGIGPRDDRPVMLLDDLVNLLKNASQANGNGQFSCSITPKQKNLAATKQFLATPTRPLKPGQTRRWVDEIRNSLGMQNIEIRGVDPRSHVARVMVEADYHMKLVGMGLEPSVPEVPSYLDSIEADEIPQSMDVLRWWFTLHPGAVQRNLDGNAFVIAKRCVRLQSENEEITRSGMRVHTGQSSELNTLFAQRFTKHYGRLAEVYPVYARLESVFQLALVAAVLQSNEVKSQIDWNTDWIVSSVITGEGNAPTEVQSIVNHRTINRRHVIVGVSGGVTVNTLEAMREPRRFPDSGTLTSDRNSARPRTDRMSAQWWWD